MNETHPRYSIVIPAFNEGSRIAGTIRQLASFFGNRQGEFEIIVVDDGSTDCTSAIAQESDRSVRLLRNANNMGKGFSVKKGILASKGQFVLFTDADLSVPVEQFDCLLWPLEEGRDVVIASRRHPDSLIRVRQPKFRVVLGVLFNLIVRVVLLPGLRDTQCGLKGYSSKAALKIFQRTRTPGWCFDVESLVIGRELGYEIVEIPVDWSDSGQTSLHPVRTVWEILQAIPVMWGRKRGGIYRRLAPNLSPTFHSND